MTQHHRFVFFIVLVDVIVLVICRTGNLIAKDLAQQKKMKRVGRITVSSQTRTSACEPINHQHHLRARLSHDSIQLCV